MPFQKGNTYGSRAGRPKKGQSTADLLRARGDLPYRAGAGQSCRERAVEVIWQQAVAGDLNALRFIVERTEGKVPDNVQVAGSGVTFIPWLPGGAPARESDEST